MPSPTSLFDKIWNMHVIGAAGTGADLIYIDRILLHERTGGGALKKLSDRGKRVANPHLVFGTLDHIIDTDPGRTDQTKFPGGADFIQTYRQYAKLHGVSIFDLDDPRQGIVHVVAPEQGIATPGATFVCADSHTGTIGALGALAWGIGSTEVEQALGTQALVQKRPRRMRIVMTGRLPKGSYAKDLVLYLIRKYGAKAALGHVVEFAGSAVEALSIEARMTICNMAIEFAAWTGIVAPDESTFDYLHGRPFAPQGAAWDHALAHWRGLLTDLEAQFERDVSFDAGDVRPQVTWGVSTDQTVDLAGAVPAATGAEERRALDYMGLEPGMAISSIPIEAAFIGSCTNSRLSDLREAAAILRGRKVAPGVLALCVPGSSQVKRAAEAEGIDAVFRAAGFEWRESGCSLCFYSGGDSFRGAKRVVSTTNRNFENRQGPGVRSHLASPAAVAASAVTGHLTDPRVLQA